MPSDLDSVSFRAWLEQQCDDVEARDNIALYVGPAMLTKPAHSFSALQAVLMAASAGSFSNLVDADFILDRRVVGGLQQVPLTLAARLGDRVRARCRTSRCVEWDDDGAVVHVGASSCQAARRVVLAVPPTVVQPDPLHAGAARRSTACPPAPVVRAGDQGAGAVRDAVLARRTGSPAPASRRTSSCTRSTTTRPRATPRGTLVGFVSDEQRRRRRPALRRRAARHACSASFAAYFGDAGARPRSPTSRATGSTRSSPAVPTARSFDLGGLTRYGAVLREPVGPIRVRQQRRRRARLPARRRRRASRYVAGTRAVVVGEIRPVDEPRG